MKKTVLLLLIILLAGGTACASSAKGNTKNRDYAKARKDAMSAFDELDGGGTPASGTTKAHAEKAFADLDSSSALLKGVGYGKTPKQARIDALGQLSNAIVAKVKGVTTLSQEEKKGVYTEMLANDIAIQSESLLKGVKFSKPIKEGTQYKITAWMTQQAVMQTLQWLMSTMPATLDGMTNAELEKVMTSIHLTTALIYAVPPQSIPKRTKLLAQLTSLKREIEKRINFGSFIVAVSQPIKATITLNGKKIVANKRYYLPRAKYTLHFTADGYKKVSASFFLQRGDRKTVEIPLIPLMQQKVDVYVRVISPVRVIDAVEQVLLDYGMTPVQDPNVRHSVVIKMSGSTITVGGYRKYQLVMDLHAFKDGKKYKITHYEHKPFFVTPETEKQLIKKNARKVAAAVVKKFFAKINVKDYLQ